MIMFWIGVFFLSLAIEFLTPTALITIWFCTGAIAAVLLELIKVPVIAQAVVFFIVSIASMLVVRPLATKYLRGNIIATNSDRVINEEGIVKKEITSQSWGEVLVKGSVWSAVEVNGKNVPVDAKVKILAIEGAKLIVKYTND